MGDPFLIRGPAVVSFSGGRTSAYMLWRILRAHGGTLPPDVLVVFCNTGKEVPETLDFVDRCSREWGVPVVWLEYRHEGRGTRKPTFAVVDHATASRAGEPFEAAVTARRGDSGYLPNALVRYCTIELKIKTLVRYLRSLGWEAWANAIGFRADEPQRVAKARAGASRPGPDDFELAETLFGKPEAVVGAVVAAARAVREQREEPVFPLHAAGVTRADVAAFWKAQPFDLAVRPDLSNCDLCFLKGEGKLEQIMRERPDLAEWWVRMERETGQRFRNNRRGYEAILERSRRPGLFPLDAADEPDELSIACHCTD